MLFLGRTIRLSASGSILWSKVVKKTLLWGTILLLAAATWISIDGLVDEVSQSDVIVVLGNKVNPDGQVSHRLQARLDCAIRIYQQGLAKRIIVSGGKGKEGFEEADVMADYLGSNGVPIEAVILDRFGYDTYHTAFNGRYIMQHYGFQSAIVVSHYYHISRCRLAFRRAGIEQVYTVSPDFYANPRDLYSICRELAGIPYYALRSYEQQ